MSPHTISRLALREPEPLRTSDTVADAGRRLLDSDLPALPVVDERGRYTGIFGEREFMRAVFPGYLEQLHTTGFLRHASDAPIELRAGCGADAIVRFMNAEHVDVSADYSDVHVAEIFLHHRVLVIPVLDDRRLVGVISRGDFFRMVARRLLNHE
ncbi:MAG TPA: CBS domain-containing protein [Solirubrobacter sp.]|nr:CBS domain-containing protein [Solirubrobacter sp.]